MPMFVWPMRSAMLESRRMHALIYESFLVCQPLIFLLWKSARVFPRCAMQLGSASFGSCQSGAVGPRTPPCMCALPTLHVAAILNNWSNILIRLPVALLLFGFRLHLIQRLKPEIGSSRHLLMKARGPFGRLSFRSGCRSLASETSVVPKSQTKPSSLSLACSLGRLVLVCHASLSTLCKATCGRRL